MRDVDLPKNSNKTYSFVFVTVVLVAIFFVVGFFIGKTDVRTNASLETSTPVSLSSFFETISSGLNLSSKDNIDPKLINDVYEVIKTQYVDKDISTSKLYNGAIKGMVESLGDSPSMFFTVEETNDYKKSIRGDFEGIGAELAYQSGRVIIKRLLPDSPASKSSLKIGDMILKVDDSDIKENEEISIVVGKIRGKAGTEVKLTVSDTTPANSREVKITRAAIHSESMDLIDEGNGVYRIRLSRFTEESLSEFNSNWDKLEKDLLSKKPKGVILDLRGNPGGYLQGAYHIAESFLTKGKVVLYVRDRDGIAETYVVETDGKLKDLPMITIVDGNSASASEILAGALSKNGRSRLIGSTTYGKGSAQSIIEPASWNGASMHITVQKWLLPDKTELTREKPIVPDIKLDANLEDIKKGNDAQKNLAIEEVKKLVK